MRSLLYYACTIYKRSKQYVIYSYIRSIYYYSITKRNRVIELVYDSGVISSLQTAISVLYYALTNKQCGA